MSVDVEAKSHNYSVCGSVADLGFPKLSGRSKVVRCTDSASDIWPQRLFLVQKLPKILHRTSKSRVPWCLPVETCEAVKRERQDSKERNKTIILPVTAM